MHLARDRRSAARIRGLAAGAVSATLALAAHGGAGGGMPDATGIFLLLATSLIVAVLGTCTPALRLGQWSLFALLSAGQLAGHEALSVASHSHGAPSATMLAVHAGAVAGCVLIIALAERLGPRCAAALRRVLPRHFAPLMAAPLRAVVLRRVEYPTQRLAVLAASVSRRGPPLAV